MIKTTELKRKENINYLASIVFQPAWARDETFGPYGVSWPTMSLELSGTLSSMLRGGNG
ncbi:hypothetical protein Fmac_027206 [Flemingia macrophylla]|uniref:Uncharacterized protein n=1 Tax=Flemingia macrophylla TaxID=520843 RepID=A0ABD1LH20_9FABA